MHERTLYLGCDSSEHRPGDKCVLESWFEGTPYGIIFEDDGDTGYFYAAHEAQGIFDALHIYNVHDIADRDIPSTISLLWDETFDLAALEINGYGGGPHEIHTDNPLKKPLLERPCNTLYGFHGERIHAVFDFIARAGHCRNAFPAAWGDWLRESNRLLDDALLARLLTLH